MTSAADPIRTQAALDPWRSHPATIVAIRPEIDGVRTYDLVLDDESVREAYRFSPGQFNMLHLPGIGEAAISISSDAILPGLLSHTVRAVGNVTGGLTRLDVGSPLLLRGPFGRPWPLSSLDGLDLVFVAGGLGLASQRAAILEAIRRHDAPRRVTIIHGAKRPGGLLYADSYEDWRRAGAAVELVVDAPEAGESGWSGRTGLVTDLLTAIPFAADRTAVLCCGPDGMMGAVLDCADRRGIPRERVFLSLERNMSCAVRHCGLCQFGPFFVCQDGPVFSADRLAPYLGVRCL
jgi:NAD(P)H-flavin reductase